MTSTHTHPVTLDTTVHHIGVQTLDLDNSLAWYRDYLGCEPTWTLTTFSDLTHRRLPGITRLTELVLGNAHLHLIERPGLPALDPQTSIVQFQHVCLAVETPEELERLRDRWIALYDSGQYIFTLPTYPTDVVVDDDGVSSFYTYDVNGLEFEFTHIPPRV
ncbi:VOC family protein [Streptomyces sp. 7N604]|uniref:VOC family protein n=1 Tax=Streptomyces sp. 7N604 TaxID=3457415 RepID=UPI003FD16AF4